MLQTRGQGNERFIFNKMMTYVRDRFVVQRGFSSTLIYTPNKNMYHHSCRATLSRRNFLISSLFMTNDQGTLIKIFLIKCLINWPQQIKFQPFRIKPTLIDVYMYVNQRERKYIRAKSPEFDRVQSNLQYHLIFSYLI